MLSSQGWDWVRLAAIRLSAAGARQERAGANRDRSASKTRWPRSRSWTRIAVVTILAYAGIINPIPSTAIALTLERDARVVTDPSPSPAVGNEADAMAVVAQYEEAFVKEDCDLFVQVTTQAFREHLGLSECETFVKSAHGRAEVIDTLELTPVSTEGMGRGSIAARVHAQARSFLDDDGQRVASPVRLEYDYRYHLIRTDGAWKIDVVHDVTGGRTEGQVTAEEEEAVDRTMAEWGVGYSTGDCDAALASTTAGYREAMGWTDCATFTQYVSDQNAYCPMDVHQEDIRFWDVADPHVGEIIVDVVQVCTLDVDEFGNPIEPPYQTGAPYRYHLVESDGTWRIAEGDDGAAAEDEPGNTNERAAIETIRTYNQAWRDSDCDAYMATTTESLRIALNIAGCASFGPAARPYGESVANFALTATDIERPSAKRMEIKTHETYDALADADGQPVETPYLVDEYWVYTLLLEDDSWVISEVNILL